MNIQCDVNGLDRVYYLFYSVLFADRFLTFVTLVKDRCYDILVAADK